MSLSGADPNARNIDAYRTILSGDLNGDDEPNFFNYGENSCHVVTGSGTDANDVLDGFTITAGNGENGAGIYNENGNLTIINCTFSNNSAKSVGGGMYNLNSNPTLTNCIFVKNSGCARGGGGNRGGGFGSRDRY